MRDAGDNRTVATQPMSPMSPFPEGTTNGHHDDHEDLGAWCSDEAQARLTTTKPRTEERMTRR
jgi:hypothetical protein